MQQSNPLIITISRELGSGGAYIGKKIAEHFNLFYANQTIIKLTAEKLSVFEADVAPHEERISSFWENFWANTGLHEFYSEAVGSFRPTTAMIFKAESEVIQEIVKEKASVIVGRAAFYVLRKYPNAIKIHLHADSSIRTKRLMEVRGIEETEAINQISVGDKERSLYIKKFTRKEWNDLNNFDLSIDTGKIGLDKAFELIVQYIEAFQAKL